MFAELESAKNLWNENNLMIGNLHKLLLLRPIHIWYLTWATNVSVVVQATGSARPYTYLEGSTLALLQSFAGQFQTPLVDQMPIFNG